MSTRFIGILLLVVFAAACGEQVPRPGTEAYVQTVTHFYTGIAAMEVGEDRRAEEHLLRVIDLAPTEAAAWADLGLLALRRNELDLAEERLNRARELAPEESRVHFLLGLVAATRGDAEQAIGHFERAWEHDPQNVRAIFALAEQMETHRGAEASAEVRRLIDAILEIDPNNLAVLVERARLAAIAGDEAELRTTIERLDAHAAGWSDEVRDQYQSVRAALSSGDMNAATMELTFLSNVLKREPAYRETLAAVRSQPGQPTELLRDLLMLPAPDEQPAPADEALTFEPQAVFQDSESVEWRWVRPLALAADGPPVLAAAGNDRLLLENGAAIDLPGRTEARGLIQTDYNYDFLVDVALAGEGGFQLYRQEESGFADVTETLGLPADVIHGSYRAGWTADVDMEGDLDLILSRREGSPLLLRNRGDGSFGVEEQFSEVAGALDFVWADLDSDGDPDAAFVDGDGAVHYFENNRSRGFSHHLLDLRARALTVTDLDANGRFELIALLHDGRIVRHERPRGSRAEETVEIASIESEAGEDAWIFTADLDNNGGVDVIASTRGSTAVFLMHPDAALVRLGGEPAASVIGAADLAGEGRLDLIGLDGEGRPVRFLNRGMQAYGSTTIRPLAAEATGDQRINPFGIGGEVEIRSGLLFQKQPISSPIVHFGLGEQPLVEVARIVWPNGDIQAEFDLESNETLQARQRLKGSCPWLFTFDGEGMRFVTDFLWRSPLGLRINAQETAGVMMTEDWVKISGDELRPRGGVYDLRITAELWETHFFDHVSLMVVDHPVGTDVFVDERFAFPPPELNVYVTSEPTRVSRVTDDAGRDVTALVAREDDRYLAAFERGQYQGVAEEHSIEIDLRDAPADRPLKLLASGWIRPTDSSINVAIGQGSQDAPTGLQLDVPDGRGGWTVVYPNLGFPAGKYKTIVVDLTDVFPADRVVRLTTNMEIYWDAIWWAEGRTDAEVRTTRLHPSTADLAYRGYSTVVQPDRSHPEVPVYDSLASSVQIWQDLAGYYTRFGDVRELLAEVDDRYVIMNAGDELRFEFEAPGEPEEGWTRSFVLVGDGWVKDGDYNTIYSETVLPLPAHDRPDYDAARVPLEKDPVYRRNADDWRRFHTRYVTNEAL